MWSRFVALVAEFCATPAPPVAPRGARVFHASPAFFHYRIAQWLAVRASTLLFIVGPMVALELAVREASNLPWALRALLYVLEGGALVGWVISLPVGYALARLDFEQRWYVVTDRSLRIREGVVIVKDMTLTFANVQNVTVEQGPLQRAFGIADLRVQTAGGGGGEQPGQPSMHTGFLRGLDDAPQLRELIMARLRVGQDAGLGDPDDRGGAPEAATQAAVGEVLAAARALGDAARRLAGS
jgi:uncharacterized membrane protein YdbT with pleckstrin-like domain